MTDDRKILVIDSDHEQGHDNGNIIVPPASAVSWVAGFFEGEGNFGPNKKKGKYICPVVQIAQSCRKPLDFVQTVTKLGGVNGPYGPYKTQTKPYYLYRSEERRVGKEC